MYPKSLLCICFFLAKSLDSLVIVEVVCHFYPNEVP
ncbi:unnamed protein product [Musa acuminata subsp. malaccensis]|uniref:(wild Malaysian banana) hypothetical protein n=1 Tax=Musa acuminata subsp. malaccensis TaxID=214687 RepID=A0A804KCW4_MUSAM|nr:unnamed protein product [Musa acuminata subsp. malaccensis]